MRLRTHRPSRALVIGAFSDRFGIGQSGDTENSVSYFILATDAGQLIATEQGPLIRVENQNGA